MPIFYYYWAYLDFGVPFSQILCFVSRIKVFGNSPSPEEIRDNYIAKNLPFILTGDACLSTNSIPWKVFDEWLVCSENGQVSQLDVEHIIRHYGKYIHQDYHLYTYLHFFSVS